MKIVLTENSIVLKLNQESLTITKANNLELFQEIKDLIEKDQIDELETKYQSFKQRLETMSQNLFTVVSGRITLKGDSTPIPQAIVKKLTELEKDGQDILPLIRFWRKLKNNPSQRSREQLYEFMLKNNVPLTEYGDLVLEKGVNMVDKQTELLLDNYSKKIDNSIGKVVEVPWENVDDDPNRTCSYGLHVAAPDYVRNIYSNSVIVEVIVNPEHVVSVPTDYNATKMRVCRYQVMGYSRKTVRSNQVVKISDFLIYPTADVIKKHGLDTKQVSENRKKRVTNVPILEEKSSYSHIETMTASQIIEYVKELTGQVIDVSLKNKKGIIKKAYVILESQDLKSNEIEQQVPKYVVEEVLEIPMDRSELIKLLKERFNESTSMFTTTTVIRNKLIKLLEQAGVKFIA